MDDKEAGANLRKYREQFEFKIWDITNWCNIEMSRYLEYEDGIVPIPIRVAFALADNFGIDEDTVLNTSNVVRKKAMSEHILNLLHVQWGKGPSDATRVPFALHRERTTRTISREQMEKDLRDDNISRKHICTYETGKMVIPIPDAIVFSEYFGLNLICFLDTKFVILPSGRINPIFLDFNPEVDFWKLFSYPV